VRATWFFVALIVATGAFGRRSAAGGEEGSAQEEEPRVLLMGKVVNLRTMRAERTVSGPLPETELTDEHAAVGVVESDDWALTGYRLSTGQQLWRVVPKGPCTDLGIAGGKLYGACADELLAFELTSGAAKVLLRGGGGIGNVSVGKTVIGAWIHHDVVALFEASTSRLLVRKRLSILGRAGSAGLMPRPSGTGVCVNALYDGVGPRGWAIKVGCFDQRLATVWTRTASFAVPGDGLPNGNDTIRQDGPDFFVLDDQPEPASDGRAPRGLSIDLRDGSTHDLTDGLIASVLDDRGERLAIPALSRSAPKVPRDEHQEFLNARDVQVATDRGRAFVLVIDEPAHLLGIDLAGHKSLFDVPVALGRLGYSVATASGYVVIRTYYAAHSRHRVEVRHPVTGQLVYQDER
jgi:hypothetical protein